MKSGDPKNHLFSKFLIILHLEDVQEWEKQQFVIYNKTIGKPGRPMGVSCQGRGATLTQTDHCFVLTRTDNFDVRVSYNSQLFYFVTVEESHSKKI